MISLRQRLSRGLISILCIIFVIQGLAADWVIRRVAEKQMATRLFEDGLSLIDNLSSDADGQVNTNGFHLSAVYDRAYSGHYYAVQVDTQTRTSASVQNQVLSLDPVGPNQVKLYHLSNGPQQQPLLVLGQGLVKFGHKIVVSVAEDLSAVDHDITSIRFAYFNLTLIILGCAIALQRFDVQKSLRPLVHVGEELEAISAGQKHQITIAVPAEINPLVKEVNHLLALVVRRLQQSRTATGNLAHALKAPLAMLFKLAEHPAFNNYPALRQQLQSQTDTIHHHIERELKRARIAGSQQASMAFNPYTELSAISKLLKQIYSEKQLEIEIKAPDTLVHFDREDMLEMIGNLLDNACKWTKQTIRVDIQFDQNLTITVEDDGLGCTELDANSLTKRGLRLDETVKGHGLGLAIVQDIAEHYEGQLHIGHSNTLGGFQAIVRLPLN